MLEKLRKHRDEEEGFTLIELLVVVIIIGILAAIAIPVFLNQRQGAWESAVESDLRNAAIQMETLMQRTGSYDTAPATLADGATDTVDGVTFTSSSDVTMTFDPDGAQGYTIEGVHANLPGASLEFDSVNGGLQEWDRP